MSRGAVVGPGVARDNEYFGGLRVGRAVDTGEDALAIGDAAPDGRRLPESADLPPPTEWLIAEAVALTGDDLDLARLVDRYWRFATDEELVGRSPRELVAAAASHRSLAQRREPGQLRVRVASVDRPALAGDDAATEPYPTAESHHTVVEIVCDDMPFLVDSVTGAITNRRLDIHLLVHPVMVVRRDKQGALTEVASDVEPDDAIAGDTVESWIRIETDRIGDPSEREALAAELRRVLTDVREAVEDWPRMRAVALTIADQLATAQLGGQRPPVPDKDLADAVALLRWLADGNFTFLGYREYDLAGDELHARPGSGMGILRGEAAKPRKLSSMSPQARQRAREKRLLIITKTNSRATVHRNAYLDYIGLKMFDADGNVCGERRFIGLFTSTAYRSSVMELPVVSRKVHEVLERSGLSPRSHSGKALLEILETYPRDELFSIVTDDLYQAAIGVLRMAGRRQLRVFLRRDHYGRFISCLIYLPRDRFNTTNRLRMQQILMEQLHGIGVEYTTRVSESALARVHFIVRTDPAESPVPADPDALAAQLADATRLWDEDLRIVLERTLGEVQAKRLYARYRGAFSEVYKEQQEPYQAIKDIAKLELLEEPGQLEMHLFVGPDGSHRSGAGSAQAPRVRFKVYRRDEPMTLSAVLPVLHSLGVRVVDEHPHEIAVPEGTIHLYDFGLELPHDTPRLSRVRGQVENAFSAAWRAETEVDGFNTLVLRAGLTWREVVVLRAYAKYLRQAGTIYSQEYLQSTLSAFPAITANLVALFEARFAPGRTEEEPSSSDLVDQVNGQLDQVENLDQDRIFRAYLALIQATSRTSFYQRGADGRPKPYVAFKLDPRALPDLPHPRPRYEIFVYSPRFEGVHLRFGQIARGGIRWSDRREDFRTEVLGLVKAQEVKNAVIVPTGAKGGFVLKQAPASRSGAAAEARYCYQHFISALLDVTDNVVGGEVVPPAGVVRHDGDDPYLVVAADKGTAAFSDLANEISARYGFWLKDAFASGGSAGYDHKRMGITARGAWESVKRHFWERGVDPQTTPFTVAGIGDMSGDVFGNGMLLSRQIMLVAAFDHRHIFLDPDPDPETSYRERERLFGHEHSSWDDYDRSLISDGGGVYPRTAKSVPVSPRVRQVLGLDLPGVDPEAPARLTPVELIRAILRAPVDLLFNGGIGTYVKSSDETHAEVGDKANDPVRVGGGQIRAEVVAEGGNLGFTQRGRVEYALSGGRIYTDFIDNSGGVDCSDREVNIKIALSGAELPRPERDQLLAEMTDQVARMVCRDNHDQAAALGRARSQSEIMAPVHRRLIAELERTGVVQRSLAGLPEEEELAQREGGLTAPELAVVMAAVKDVAKDQIADSALPDEAWTGPVLAGYFPTPLRRRLRNPAEPADRDGDPGLLAQHRLRREIVTLSLVNEMVNRGGSSFLFRAVEETGADPADVLRAYVVIRDVYDLPALWEAVEAYQTSIPAQAHDAVFLTSRRLLDRAVRWLLQNHRSPLDVPAEVDRFRAGVSALLPRLGELYQGVERESLEGLAAALRRRGVPVELADWTSRVAYGFGLLDIVEVAAARGCQVDDAAGVYFTLSERFRIDTLLSRISALTRTNRWQTLARMALRYDLYAVLAALTSEVISKTPASGDPVARVFAWEQDNEVSIERTRNAMKEVDTSAFDLAALSVLLRQIRTLVRTTSTPAA